MTKAKLSIHEAAAALLKEIDAPLGTVSTMVDIDERKGDVIRVLVVPGYAQAHLIPRDYMGYPVIVARQPAVHAFGRR